MSRKRYTPAQIIGKLREADVALTAEAVEKVNPLDHFIPDFFPSSIEAKSRISDYKL
jgi:hypothetical protein